ncbi:MAG TPA: hypothetical protein VG323_02340 [Thermoanaerobaculia bacterium]|nr:hypothetical protein [Thermoanaerobaculia bacterium]
MRKVVLLLFLTSGCSLLHTTRPMANELERVAKDWCMTIRASQVLCVYPLSEDVQVGDLYLVNRSIDDQVNEYQARGFLPFDILLTRLQPNGYEQMYNGFYKTTGAYGQIPHQWQFPPNGTGTATDWASAPRAAFPSYTFAVQRGQGFKIAVPVQSVPIGLSLLNTGSASGSIEIADTSTYGIDEQTLQAQVEAWASCPASRSLLSRYAPQTDAAGKTQQQYVRVITRVYLAGAVNVSLQNNEARSAGLDAGAAQAVNLIATDTSGAAAANAASNYASVLSSLNTSINGAAGTTKPGGSIRIAAASSRSVTLNETFPRPLVIGYIAFDRPIGAGGVLGSAQPTLQRLEGRPLLPASEPTAAEGKMPFGVDANTYAIRQWLKTSGNRELLGEWLQKTTQQKLSGKDIPFVEAGETFAALRQQIVDSFGIGGACASTH